MQKDNNTNDIKTCQTEINNDTIKNIETFSDSSSFTLNIYDYNNEGDKNKYIINEKIKENKIFGNLSKENKENLCTRKCSIFSNSYETTEECTPRNSESKINENKETKTVSNFSKKIINNKNNNKQINNILK